MMIQDDDSKKEKYAIFIYFFCAVTFHVPIEMVLELYILFIYIFYK